jgi:hypothetical protein
MIAPTSGRTIDEAELRFKARLVKREKAGTFAGAGTAGY